MFPTKNFEQLGIEIIPRIHFHCCVHFKAEIKFLGFLPKNSNGGHKIISCVHEADTYSPSDSTDPYAFTVTLLAFLWFSCSIDSFTGGYVLILTAGSKTIRTLQFMH